MKAVARCVNDIGYLIKYLWLIIYSYWLFIQREFLCCDNFTVAKMPELDSAGRIAMLTEKIGAIQKRYAELKAEVAYLDRKKRRAKQREREGEYNYNNLFLLY